MSSDSFFRIYHSSEPGTPEGFPEGWYIGPEGCDAAGPYPTKDEAVVACRKGDWLPPARRIAARWDAVSRGTQRRREYGVWLRGR